MIQPVTASRTVRCEWCGAIEHAARGPAPKRTLCRACIQRRRNSDTEKVNQYQRERRAPLRAQRLCSYCECRPPRPSGKYCSDACLKEATRHRLRVGQVRVVRCPVCEAEVSTDRPNQTYCSAGCRHRHDARLWKPTRQLYRTARWLKLRAEQLAKHAACAACGDKATVCDHIEPHRGDEARFWSGPFQSLCKPCHDGPKQRLERRGGSAKSGGYRLEDRRGP